MTVDPSTEKRLNRLRAWNVGVGLVLAAQAVLIAALTNGFSLPVTATFMTGPPGSPARLHHLFDVPIGWGVFAFLAISAGRCSSSPRRRSSAGTGATCCTAATTAAGSSTSSARR